MRITPLKQDSEHCDDCRRPAIYRVRIRNATNLLLCDCCAVRLVVRLVELVATAEAQRLSSGVGSGRKPMLRKL
jgi:hypothetical protein